MLIKSLFCIAVSLGISQVHADAFQLGPIFEREQKQPSPQLEQYLRRIMPTKQVVYVDGIMNELAGILDNYFYDAIQETYALGGSVSHLGYSSFSTIPENAENLVKDLENMWVRIQKPIVLIGHSRGGAEALYALLTHPELMLEGKVEKVILIQAAIGGSIIAERLQENVLGWVLYQFMGSAFNSLRRDVAHHNFEEAFAVFNQKVPFSGLRAAVSNRVFYIRSTWPQDDGLSRGLNIVLKFSDRYALHGTPNDGLLALEDQMLPTAFHFGNDLGILEADHISLVVSGAMSGLDEHTRRAFTRAFLASAF